LDQHVQVIEHKGAVMIGALAVAAADETGAAEVNDLHLRLGVIAESRRWDRQHRWGPSHLRVAAERVGTTLSAIENRARQVPQS
jgi:hypothetical protein